ncbi:BURP domain-containing protein BNM2A-like [Humulus lupulus]|uniref:BURP domain-containing protein BNM2A-like n=1 Tax=Humulus lupulus TaxID=3486 RepID=UPI002B40EBDE|nr:BURP domain-containing protein BNM2A-like [Humulus lupulus]
MGFGVASWKLLIHLLFFQQLAYGNHDESMMSKSYIQLPSSKTGEIEVTKVNDSHGEEKGNTQHFQAHDHLSHMEMDPNLMIFFTPNDLKVGKTMPVYFPKIDPSIIPPRLLPLDESSSIPFSLKQLPFLLNRFSFSQHSPQGRAVEDTLKQCESRSINGETKMCATSLESMLDFACGAFGLEDDISVVTTTHLTNLSVSLQNYTILEVPKEILPHKKKMVACHTMPYPYAVYYCHYQDSENKVYKILLGGENGDKVEAIAVCHMDTSQWSRNHVSFRVLRIEPGTLPVCHFFPSENLVWIPKPIST